MSTTTSQKKTALSSLPNILFPPKVISSSVNDIKHKRVSLVLLPTLYWKLLLTENACSRLTCAKPNVGLFMIG